MNVDRQGETRGALLQDAEARLEEASVPSARRNSEWLLCEALDESRIEMLTRLSERVPAAVASDFERMVRRRLTHEPLQYILGYTEFFGIRLQVTPDVLIPRPETEQVVEAGIQLIRDRPHPRVLDVGTGSGCIALAIKAQREDAQVWACDVSDSALEVAAANARSLELSVRLFKGDALAPDFIENAPPNLDLLISNPPYISEGELGGLPTEVSAFEPHLALFSRDDPIEFYRKLGAAGLDLLAPGGYIVFETHADFGSDAARVLDELNYLDVELMKDYSDRPRILCARRPIYGD